MGNFQRLSDILKGDSKAKSAHELLALFCVSGNCSSKCIFVNQSMISGEYVGPLHRQSNFLHSYILLKSNYLRTQYIYIACVLYNVLKHITVNVFMRVFAHITNHVFKTI